MATGPRVFSIPPGAPFLRALVDALLAGRLVPGFPDDPGDPMALARTTIYVPTRRAARSLRSMLVERNAARSAILPTIRPLGDVDEDAAVFAGGGATLDIAPPIGAAERLVLLARLVRVWRERLPEHVMHLFGAEDVSVPTMTADAIWLARDLADLMDEVETEGADWDALKTIAPGDLADWWQITLSFLSIVGEAWPAILAERDRLSPAIHRNRLIALETERLRTAPPAGPVIVAGSTGSIPATADLIAAIARLPMGAVVLPGLDRDMDDAGWDAVGAPEHDPSVFGHPQYGLKKLLVRIGILRDGVEVIGGDPSKRLRERVVSEALRPAETTDAWAGGLVAPDGAAAFEPVSLIEAANEREEALAIALALREAIDDPQKTAALVTVDRGLARRVAAELSRFGVLADDSGGRLLHDALPATLLRLILDQLFDTGDPVALLSLLKHPLTALGLKRSTVRHAGESIELIALRGGTGRVSVTDLPAFLERRLTAATHGRVPDWTRRLSDGDVEAARDVCARLAAAVGPLAELAAREDRIDLRDAVRASVETLENLARDEAGSVAELYAGDAGEKFAGVLRELAALDTELDFPPHEWPTVAEALISGEMVKPRPGGHPRLFIWGALEARLQSVDTIVIGGLNEGTWPAKTRGDPFMSRPMKAFVALEPPERRTGLAAHDFQMALGMDRVVLSRAARAENAPTVPSRWLKRLETVLGEDATKAMRQRGNRYVRWSRDIDAAPDIPFAKRPEPRPPLAARPRRFSVTEIETLRRDPYAIYAKRILRLRPLEPLIRDPAAAERGTLFHDILAAFTQSGPSPAAQEALEALRRIARDRFDEEELPPDIEAVWWPRLLAFLPNFLEWERGREPQIAASHAEIAAAPVEIGPTGVTLSGRADRIDVLRDGTATIIDYKTGSTPSKRQAHMLLSPQLPLEAALLALGGFTGLGAIESSDLVYVRLKARGELVPESILKVGFGSNASEKTGFELAEQSWTRLGELVAHYGLLETGYLSRALPFRETDLSGDYDHLARVLEWSAGGGETGE